MYNQAPAGERRWNIFARVLEDILEAHGSPLSMLDNYILDDRELVHRAKVSRLQQSLKEPKSFPLLSPFDIERIQAFFALSEAEMSRLRLAVVATAVERILMDRTTPENAYNAAEALFQALLHPADVEEFAQFSLALLRHGKGDTGMENQPMMAAELQEEVEPTLSPALDALDRAMSALHLGLDANSPGERLYRLRLAREGFVLALEKLHQTDAAIRDLALWRYWHDEAERGLKETAERLAALEAR